MACEFHEMMTNLNNHNHINCVYVRIDEDIYKTVYIFAEGI